MKYVLNAPFDCSQMLWMPNVVEIHCQRPVEMLSPHYFVQKRYLSQFGRFHLSAAIALSRVQVRLTCISSQLDTRLNIFFLFNCSIWVFAAKKVAPTSTLPAGRRQRVRGGWKNEEDEEEVANCLQSSPSSPEVAPPPPPPPPSPSSSSPSPRAPLPWWWLSAGATSPSTPSPSLESSWMSSLQCNCFTLAATQYILVQSSLFYKL